MLMDLKLSCLLFDPFLETGVTSANFSKALTFEEEISYLIENKFIPQKLTV